MFLTGGIPKTLSRLQKDVADADVIQRADVFADGRSQLRLFAGKADGDVELEAVIAERLCRCTNKGERIRISKR